MQIVCAIFGYIEHLRAGIATIFGVEIIGDDLYFFDRSEVEWTKRTACTRDGNVRGRDAIHSDVIAAPSASVGIKAAGTEIWIVGGNRSHAGR